MVVREQFPRKNYDMLFEYAWMSGDSIIYWETKNFYVFSSLRHSEVLLGKMNQEQWFMCTKMLF
jgi:hypothetical protein